MSAIVATAHKIAEVFYIMVKNKVEYDENDNKKEDDVLDNSKLFETLTPFFSKKLIFFMLHLLYFSKNKISHNGENHYCFLNICVFFNDRH